VTLQLIGVREAAQRLGLAVQTLYNMVSQGRIPSVRLGRRRLFDVRELERFVRECSTREREWPPARAPRARLRRSVPKTPA
jgi:excisionase family DNA binding protein